MAKASPIRNSFQGEISELAQGRTDIERYAKSMRFMNNFIANRIGPAVRRPGTTWEGTTYDETRQSFLHPFIFSDEEVAVMEFAPSKLRFWYEYVGVAAHREFAVTTIDIAYGVLSFVAPGHDYVAGEHLVFDNFPGDKGINGQTATVTLVTGDTVQTNLYAFETATELTGDETVACIYEVDTPWLEADLVDISICQWLDVVYVFCDGYPVYMLKRFDTFDWTCTPMPAGDGPYLEINSTTTRLIPLSKGTWVPDMTSNTAPTGVAAADSEVVGHEAYKAFDGNLTSYWEGTQDQEGWLEYSFVNGDLSNKIPLMTAATTAGCTISASSELVIPGLDQSAWHARDGDSATDWKALGNCPQWIKIQLPAPQTIQQYTLRASRSKMDSTPKAWSFEGSNDGVAWTLLDHRSNSHFDTGQKKHFIPDTTGSYLYYRITIEDVRRGRYTTVVPSTGTVRRPGFKKAHTTTVRPDPIPALANIELLGISGIPRVVNGYTIHLGYKNSDSAASQKDHGPTDWTFEGWDGIAWYVLHVVKDETVWGKNRSNFYDIQNDNSYQKYRLNIMAVKKNGSVKPRIGSLQLASPDAPDIDLLTTSIMGINDDRGFQVGDIGRVMRLRDADNLWRWGVITAVPDNTHIKLNPTGKEPLLLPKHVTDWRLGLWSGTTGWPTCGTFFEERLWMAGCKRYPDTIAASETAQFSSFQQSSPRDEVLDDHALVLRCASKHMSRIRWLSSDENAVIAGTGTGEFIFTSPNDEPMTARNVAARPITTKGVANVLPVRINSETLMVQRSRRQLYAVGGDVRSSGQAYVANPITLLGAHLAFPLVTQIVYSQEPHAVLWARRSDGSVISMTYDKELDLTGGQRHDFGGVVESICVVPSPKDSEDSLYMVIRRVINKKTRRYVERLSKFWDFGMELNKDATFVDSAVRSFEPPAISVLYGLRHLTGEKITVLADGLSYRDMVVAENGSVTIPSPAAQYIVAGKHYVSEAEITGLDDGAGDRGTSQGKVKRAHNLAVRLWDSAGGEVGRWNEDSLQIEYTPVEYVEPYDQMRPVTLQTGTVGPMILPMGFGPLGSVWFRQDDPFPFNMIALYPQLVTNDR